VNMGMVQDVMDIIANSYGSSPSAMDRSIAAKIINYFYERGWMNSEEIAYLVHSAGGEIRITESVLAGPAPTLQRHRDPVTGDLILRTTNTDDLVRNAKVNPDAESRTVDSGPIVITTVKDDES
jgi:hypothetical protein